MLRLMMKEREQAWPGSSPVVSMIVVWLECVFEVLPEDKLFYQQIAEHIDA